MKNFDSESKLSKEENIAKMEELKANVVLYEAQVKHIETTLKHLETQQAKERDEFDIQGQAYCAD